MQQTKLSSLSKLKAAKNTGKVINLQPQIDHLEDVEHVRKRPGMWIPSIDYFVYELLDNSLDEHVAGFGNVISTTITKDREVTVKDEGRGVPTAPSTKFPDKSQAELAFSSLKAGSKFNMEKQEKTSGLNGVGSSCINFLSEYFDVTICREGKKHHLAFEKGKLTQKLQVIDTVDENVTGTTVVCKPDAELWKSQDDFNMNAILLRLKQVAYINPGLTIKTDLDYGGLNVKEEYRFDNGVTQYVEELLENKEALTDVFTISNFKKMALLDKEERNNEIEFDIAFAYSDSYNETIYGFCNNVATTNNNSSQITGFKRGLNNAIKEYYDSNVTKNKNKVNFTAEDIKEGLVAVINIKVTDPHYSGQGKEILKMPTVGAAISNIVKEHVLDILDKNPDTANIIIAKILDACRVREAARKARETARKSKNAFSGSVSGLTPCESNNPEESFIWFTEGDSAGGTAKDARDKRVDAILPIFGKILNTYDLSLNKILDSEKIMKIIKALGTGIDEEFNIEKLKYHNIVLLTDADNDGLHIRILFILFFWKRMRQIIDNGHLYIAQPPLFTIRKNPRTKKEENIYAWTIDEVNEIVAKLDCKYEIQRNKGLGEMSAEELEESTMNVNTRRLLRVTAEDVEECERMLSVCMNEKDITNRKDFILTNRPVLVREGV